MQYWGHSNDQSQCKIINTLMCVTTCYNSMLKFTNGTNVFILTRSNDNDRLDSIFKNTYFLPIIICIYFISKFIIFEVNSVHKIIWFSDGMIPLMLPAG